MDLKSILTVTLFLIYCACADRVTYKKVCYYTNWSQYRPDVGKFLPKDIDPFLCTHVIFAFAKLAGNRIVAREWNDETVPWKKGLYEHVTDLKKVNPKLKVLLSVGGWNAGGKPFSDMAATQTGRKEFATSTVTFLRKRYFDGLDIDWEFPGSRGGSPYDRDNLSLLLKEVSTVFEKEERAVGRDKLLLSIAVPASQDKIDYGYKVPDVSLYCDMINVMTYNYHGSWEKTIGHHSALFKRNEDTTEYQSKLNVAWTMNYWIRMGAKASKLILGFPQFGRGYTLSDASKKAVGDLASGGSVIGSYTKETGFLAYYEICKMQKYGAVVTWDDVQKVPHLVLGDQWIGFDNEQSIKEKVKWFKNYKFGGIMVWALALDDFRGDQCGDGETYPILRSIVRELNRTDPATDALQTSSNIISPDSTHPVTSDKTSPDILAPESTHVVTSEKISSDSVAPDSAHRVSSNIVQIETVGQTDTLQGAPLVGTSSIQGKSLLKNAKDQSSLVTKTGQNNPEGGMKVRNRKKDVKTTVVSDPKIEVLSDAIISPNKKVVKKVVSSEGDKLLKSSSMHTEPLIKVNSKKPVNHPQDQKSNAKAQILPITQVEKVKPVGKNTNSNKAPIPIVTGTVLSDSFTRVVKGRKNIIGKAKVLDELKTASDKSTLKSNAKQTKSVIKDTDQTVPLMKAVVKTKSADLKDDNRIVGTQSGKIMKKVKTSNPKDGGARLSSSILTKGKDARKLANSVSPGTPPVFSPPDMNDLQLSSSQSGAAVLTGKQTSLENLKDKTQNVPVNQADISAKKVATTDKKNDATPNKNPSNVPYNNPNTEQIITTPSTATGAPSGKMQSGTKRTKQNMSPSTKQTRKNKDSKTQSKPGNEEINTEENSKFTSRKLLQMIDTSDSDGGNGGGLGGMINSLFGMMSGLTRSGNGRQRPQEPRRSTVTDNPLSFNTGSNDIRNENRIARQRQRMRNVRRDRPSTSRDRPVAAINNRDNAIGSIDRLRNTRDRSLSRNGRERSIAVDRAGSIPNRSNQFPVDTLVDVSPLPPTANPFDIIEIQDRRLRGGRASIPRGTRTVGVQERFRGRPMEDTRTPQERALDAMILSEQLPDPGSLDSQNRIRSMAREQLRNEAELLLTRDQLGTNDPFQRDVLQTQIRDPALIRSREPGLVETLRRRISDTGRSRGNSGVATNIQTTERGRGRAQADARLANGGRFQSSEATRLSRNSNLRRNIAVDSFNNRNRMAEGQRGVQRSGSRSRTAIGLQGSGTDRQNPAEGAQRTTIGVQNSGVSGNDRQRSVIGIQGPGRDRQRNPVGIQNIAPTRRRTAVGVNDAGNERQRTAIGVQNVGSDRQRVGVGAESRDRQRIAASILGTGNNRQRTPISVQSTGTGPDRRATGVQSVGASRQRTIVGVQAVGSDRQRPAVGVLNADRQRAILNGQTVGNDRQRMPVGVSTLSVQNGRSSRPRPGIGVQGQSIDRQRTAIGVANADRQRTVIGVQRLSNDRQRTSVGIQGLEVDRQRPSIGVQSSDRQRTTVGIQRAGNDRQRTSVERTPVGIQEVDRQRPSIGVQGSDRQRVSIGVQRAGSDRQRTQTGERTPVGIQSLEVDRQRPSIGVQSNDRQRPSIGISRTGNDRQRTPVGIQEVDRQRPSIGVQSSDRQRTVIGVQRAGNDRQRTLVGIQEVDRQRPSIGVQNSDRQRTVISVQRAGNDRQRTPVGIQEVDRQRPSIGVQSSDRQRTVIGVQRAGNDRQTIGVQRSGNGRQRTSVGIQSSVTDRQNPSIGVKNSDRQRTAISVQRSGNDRQRLSVGVQGTTNPRIAVGVDEAGRQRTSIGVGVQRPGNERQRTAIEIQSPVNSLPRTAVGIQPSADILERSRVNTGITAASNRRAIATNSISGSINDLQSTIAQNAILKSERSSLNTITGGNNQETNRIIGISGSVWKTIPETPVNPGNGARPVALVSPSENRNAIEKTIEELLAQMNAQQPPTVVENVRPTIAITPTKPSQDSSLRIVPLNNFDNLLLNSLPQGPPIQIVNETERQPPVIGVAGIENSIGASNAIDLINSLAANRMSMPDSPMANSLMAENLLAAVAASQPSPTIDVVNKPILLEIQPQILPTEPTLNKDITDVLVQLLRDNLLNQNAPHQTRPVVKPATPALTTPPPFKQDAMQTPNQVLVSTGEKPKNFPSLPPTPRRQAPTLATNETVVANKRPQKGLSKADVLWKWEA
ncbi:uncharacterized protein LOC117321389 [Pecten maximus]|uniref:uncharacterized protein LOC117321389 n=1 Tax=Pecten maximus TaxID=6579 RepID=UPI0014582258|nr:uncharacterized protein LOC117321389 [Pecten maximus]